MSSTIPEINSHPQLFAAIYTDGCFGVNLAGLGE